MGYAIYKGGVRINLSRFFRFTGFVLVLVAAGLLASAVHTAHEAGWIDVLQAQAFDLRWLVAPGSVRAALLTGMLGLQPVPTVGETLAWLLYAVPMGLYVLWPLDALRRRPNAAPAPVARDARERAATATRRLCGALAIAATSCGGSGSADSDGRRDVTMKDFSSTATAARSRRATSRSASRTTDRACTSS